MSEEKSPTAKLLKALARKIANESAAKACRDNGWVVGDHLVGVHPAGEPCGIRITAIGESGILARRHMAMECVWMTLKCFRKCTRKEFLAVENER